MSSMAIEDIRILAVQPVPQKYIEEAEELILSELRPVDDILNLSTW